MIPPGLTEPWVTTNLNYLHHTATWSQHTAECFGLRDVEGGGGKVELGLVTS